MTRMATAGPHPGAPGQSPGVPGQAGQGGREIPDQDMPDYDAKLEALVPVVAGELPAHFHAHRADDIATAVRIARSSG